MSATRLAIVASHPIQHFCPQYVSWSRLPSLEIRVFFASQHGLTPYRDKDFAREVQWEGLPLDFPHEFLPGAESRSVGARLDAPALGQRLEAYAPDAVLVYGYIHKLQRRAISWAASRKTPLLMVADSELHSPRNWMTRSIKALVVPRILAKIDRFLTIGDANEAYYRHYGVTDGRLVRSSLPIDIATYDRVLAARSDARARVRQKHGIPDHHRVVLMVGKLVPWKRQGDLIEFSNSIQTTRDDVTVVLAGTGPDEARLRASCRSEGVGGVVFAGFVPPTELPDYCCAADVYVHCAEREPHSVAISEAIYSGLPVVLSDRCGSYGPTDDVRVGINGYVYPCGAVSELADLVLRISDSLPLRQSMSEASTTIGRANQRLAHGDGLMRALDGLFK